MRTYGMPLVDPVAGETGWRRLISSESLFSVPLYGPNTCTLVPRPYVVRNAASSDAFVGAMFSTSADSPGASHTLVGKSKSIPPVSRHVLVGASGLNSGRAFVVMFNNS